MSGGQHNDYYCEEGSYSDDEAEDTSSTLPPPDEKMGEEEWQSYFEDQLCDLYTDILRLFNEGGWPIFDKLSYPAFAAFAYASSSKYPCVR